VQLHGSCRQLSANHGVVGRSGRVRGSDERWLALLLGLARSRLVFVCPAEFAGQRADLGASLSAVAARSRAQHTVNSGRAPAHTCRCADLTVSWCSQRRLSVIARPASAHAWPGPPETLCPERRHATLIDWLRASQVWIVLRNVVRKLPDARHDPLGSHQIDEVWVEIRNLSGCCLPWLHRRRRDQGRDSQVSMCARPDRNAW
jgi:hypothetical protein